MTSSERLLRRASEATRSSKRVAVKTELDWADVARDVAALANSGGGVVVVDGATLEEEELHEQLERFLEPEFEEVEVHDVSRAEGHGTAIVIDGVVGGPVLFSRDGGRRGQVYFRHGARSEPASGSRR